MSSMSGASGFGIQGNKIPKGYRKGQIQQFTPEQMQLFQQMFGQVGPESYLSKLAGGDESLFQQIEAPAYRQFAEQTGALASRFSGMGQGGRHTSGFQNEMTAGASNLAENLASQRQALQRQAIMDLMGLSSNLLSQRPYEQFLVEKQQKQSGIPGLVGAGIGGVGGFLLSGGNPMGAIAGASLGHTVGSGFGGGGGGGGKMASFGGGGSNFSYDYLNKIFGNNPLAGGKSQYLGQQPF